MSKGAHLPETTYPEAVRRWHDALASAGCPERLPSELVPAVDAIGRVPARPLRTMRPCPTYRAAAMDGFAVRSSALAGASRDRPVVLRIGAETLQVDTGGDVPDDLDAVVEIERVSANGDCASFRAPVDPGKNLRLPGEDVPPGVVVGWPGYPLRSVDCAALVAGGVVTVEVVKQLRVAVIPSGNEIVAPGSAPKAGTVIDSNSTLVAGHVRSLAAKPQRCEVVPDDSAALEAALRRAVSQSDLVILLAGTSRGRRDQAAIAIAAVGTVDVHGVATRPAKPVSLGHAGRIPIVNLPGYPVACDVAFFAYAAPLIRRLAGLAEPLGLRARLATEVVTDGLADEWHCATLLSAPGSPRAVVVPPADIGGNLYRLSQADARFHLRRGTSRWPRHVAVPWMPLREPDDARRALFVGPYDPLVEELAALGGFRCRWTDDECGAALDEGLAEAAGIVLRSGGTHVLRRRAGRGRKLLILGLRREGIAYAEGSGRPRVDRCAQPSDPWETAAAVAAGTRPAAHCTAYVARQFGLSFDEGEPAQYAVVWEEGPGRRFPWGIVLGTELAALRDRAEEFGWKEVGRSHDVQI